LAGNIRSEGTDPVDHHDFGFEIPDGYEVVFRKSVTDPDGTVLYAKDFGLEYFLLLVPTAEVPKDEPSTWTV
jgi:hypothetical protein